MTKHRAFIFGLFVTLSACEDQLDYSPTQTTLRIYAKDEQLNDSNLWIGVNENTCGIDSGLSETCKKFDHNVLKWPIDIEIGPKSQENCDVEIDVKLVASSNANPRLATMGASTRLECEKWGMLELGLEVCRGLDQNDAFDGQIVTCDGNEGGFPLQRCEQNLCRPTSKTPAPLIKWSEPPDAATELDAGIKCPPIVGYCDNSNSCLCPGTKNGCPCECSPDTDMARWPMPDTEVEGPFHPNYSERTVSDAKLVLDHVTGLEWLAQNTKDPPYTHDQAKKHCNELKSGGSIWRLPSRIELISLYDSTLKGSRQLDEIFKKVVAVNALWSATSAGTDGAGKPLAWSADFSNEQGPLGSSDTSDPKQVLCVRTAIVASANTTCACVAGASFVDDRYCVTDEIAEDVYTGLKWMRHPLGPMKWADANDKCRAMGSQWRLPTAKQLSTLLVSPPASDTAGHPMIASVFEEVRAEISEGDKAGRYFVWSASATQRRDGGTDHASINFNDLAEAVKINARAGAVVKTSVGSGYYALCVSWD